MDGEKNLAFANRMKIMQRIRDKSFVGKNKKRFYGKDEGMSRWVGSSINFEAPITENVGVKISKKLRKKTESEHRMSVPDLISSKYLNQKDSFNLPENSRCFNNDNFVYAEGGHKIGR